MYKAYLQIRSYSRRVRAAGGGVPRGGLPGRGRGRVPARRLPLLPHPRATAAGAAPPLTRPEPVHTHPPPPLTHTHTTPHPSHLDPPSFQRSRLWHTRERQLRPDRSAAPAAEVLVSY